MWGRSLVEGRASPPVQAVRSTAPLNCPAAFGPVVEIVTVTAVVPAPAAIVAGLKAQLLNAGKPEHPKLTAELNVPPPIGTAENV
jgi:hypothetical protein